MTMQRNVGGPDRLIRVVAMAPLAIGGGVLVGPASPLSWILYVVAGAMMITGIVGFCPLYAVFGWSTCRRQGLPSGMERRASV